MHYHIQNRLTNVDKKFVQPYSTGKLKKIKTNSIWIRVEVADEEVIETIRKLRNRKSPEEDAVSNEMRKYGGYTFIK
jgi:hypothetical protein